MRDVFKNGAREWDKLSELLWVFENNSDDPLCTMYVLVMSDSLVKLE